MIYCRDCRRLWPSGSTICGTCRRSFGGRLCPKNHLSPAAATCCTTCGNLKLLRPARQISFTPFLSLAACIVGLVILKFLVARSGFLWQVAVGAADAIGSFVVGRSLACMLGSLFQAVVVLALVWLAIRTIIGKNSDLTKSLERLFASVTRFALKVAAAGVRAFARWVGGCAQARTRRRDPREEN